MNKFFFLSLLGSFPRATMGASVPEVDEVDLAMMTIEMQKFVLDNEFDKDIIDTLKDLDPEMQEAVVAKGPLDNARNPNAVIKARIIHVRRQKKWKEEDGEDREQFEAEVETYIQDNNLDERCRNVLLETEKDVVRELMTQTLNASRNPSAVVLSRVRRIQDEQMDDSSMQYGMARKNKNPTLKEQEDLEAAMDKYILDNEIDDRAANVLREQKFWVQKHLLNDSLEGVRNPSAVILCRIKRLTTDSHPDDWYDWKGKGKGKGKGWYDDYKGWGKGWSSMGKGYGGYGGYGGGWRESYGGESRKGRGKYEGSWGRPY